MVLYAVDTVFGYWCIELLDILLPPDEMGGGVHGENKAQR